MEMEKYVVLRSREISAPTRGDMGALWLGETRLLQHLLAACLMVLGVVLIVL